MLAETVEQMERELRALVRAGVIGTKGTSKIEVSALLLKEFSRREGYYEFSRLVVDVETREAWLNTWNESGHNGDEYGNQTEAVDWERALRFVYPGAREIALGWLQARREEEKRARERAEMGAAYRKLVAEPERKTFFDRLLSEED